MTFDLSKNPLVFHDSVAQEKSLNFLFTPNTQLIQKKTSQTLYLTSQPNNKELNESNTISGPKIEKTKPFSKNQANDTDSETSATSPTVWNPNKDSTSLTVAQSTNTNKTSGK